MSDRRRGVYLGLHLVQTHFRRVFQGVTSLAHLHRLPWEIMINWDSFSRSQESSGISGAIIQGGWGDLREVLRQASRPWVQVSAAAEPEPGEFAVLPDNPAIGKVAAEHFLGAGFREFAFFGAQEHWYSRQRRDGFLATLGKRPCRLHESGENRGRTVASWLSDLPQGTALFCATDIFARSAIRHLKRLGRAVPEEIAVAGVDDDDLEWGLSGFPISSVDPRSKAIGSAAANMLAALFAGKKPAQRVARIRPGGMVVRQSSAVEMIEDREVAQLLARIRENACKGMEIAELLKGFRISRRTIERRFQTALGRGIESEIRRVRIEHAKELLAALDLPIGQVALTAGFNDIYYFSTAFKRATGLTPSAWRAENRASGYESLGTSGQKG
jgi:LacI family transcriptional regulator